MKEHLELVEQLIGRMNSLEPMDLSTRSNLAKAYFRVAIDKMAKSGGSLNQAVNGPDHLSLDEIEFQHLLKKVANDGLLPVSWTGS